MSGWPWPLDAVQAWFDGLWGWISDAAVSAVSVVSGWVNDGLEWLWGQVQSVGTWIVDSAKAAIKAVGSAVNDVGKALGSAFSDAVDVITKGFSAVGSWIVDNVGPAIEGIGSAVTSAADGIASFVTSGLETIGQGIVDLGSSVLGTITGWVDGALKWASDSFTWLAQNVETIGANIINSVGGAFEAVGSAIVNGIGGVIGPITEGLKGVFDVLGGLGSAFNPAQMISDATAALQSIFSAFTTALSSKSMRSPEEAYNITWDTINQVSAAYFTQAISLIVAEAVSVGQLDISPQSLQHTPQMEAAFSTVQTLYATMADISLVRPLQYYFNRAFTPEIPPTPDLIRFVVREVIVPERFYEMMTWKGFSQEWGLAYWEAHWNLPEPGRLVDAFHRGVLTQEELNKYIVWHDYKPEKRPGIGVSDVEIFARTQKQLIPRVDLRYAWEMGQLTREDLVDRYKALGYEDDAELMADIQLNRAMVEEINKVRNEELSAFIAGYIDESALRANLAALGISEDRIEYYTAYAKKRRVRNNTKELLDIYQDGYVNDMITDEELLAYAEGLIVDEEARILFVKRAYVRKFKKPAEPTEEEIRLVTLATLSALLRGGQITGDQYTDELQRRGYPADQIELLFKAEELKGYTEGAGAD